MDPTGRGSPASSFSSYSSFSPMESPAITTRTTTPEWRKEIQTSDGWLGDALSIIQCAELLEGQAAGTYAMGGIPNDPTTFMLYWVHPEDKSVQMVKFKYDVQSNEWFYKNYQDHIRKYLKDLIPKMMHWNASLPPISAYRIQSNKNLE